MYNSVKLASIEKDENVIKDITQYEKDLSQKIGQDIILIAYTKDQQ